MTETTSAETRQLLAFQPVLFVADIAATIRYYQKTLGFQKDWDYGTPAFYASVSRDGIAFHLRQIASPLQHSGREEADTVDFYITVSDVDSLYNELTGRGANIFYGPVRQEYGMREFYIEDCNGYRVGFGQPSS